MADAHAAAGAAPGVGHAAHEQETRLILLPVDLDEASVGAVQWAANNVLRAGDAALLLHVLVPPLFGEHALADMADPPGDTALLLHVVPSTYMALEPSLGLGGEGVFMSIPDPEAERLRREAAERFLTNKLEPVLTKVPGLNVRRAVLRFATDADSVGRLVCTNAEELGAAMVIIPSHGKGKLREMFMGSTSNYCTHHCKVPVTVLR